MKRTLLISGMLLATLSASAAPKSTTGMQSAKHPLFLKDYLPTHIACTHIACTHIAGQVRCVDGKPAGNAQLFLSWTTDKGEVRLRRITVDSQGIFRTPLLFTPKPRGDEVRITAVLPGQGLVSQITPLTAKDLDKLTLKLLPAAALTGYIVRPDGNPIANTTVALESLASAPKFTLGDKSIVTFQSGLAPDVSDDLLNSFAGPIPNQILTLLQTRTDATGRFTLTGPPVKCGFSLRLGNGLLLSTGSMNTLRFRSPDHHDLGPLVAVQSGRIQLHLTDRQTGKPAHGVIVNLVAFNRTALLASSVEGSRALFAPTTVLPDRLQGTRVSDLGVSIDLSEASGGVDGSALTDTHGDLEFAGLRPGDYKVLVQGRALSVHLEEGRTTPPIRLALRQGELHGRLLDSKGKPLSDVSIRVFDGTPHNLVGEVTQVAFANSQMAVDIVSGEGGYFTLDTIPWGTHAITIRALHGNDLAEWTGSPDQIGQNLVLKMQANALVTITGRLLDSQRHPIEHSTLNSPTFKALHWLDSPRSTWLATAHQAALDGEGNFRIEGLERGESFSLVSTPMKRMIGGNGSFQTDTRAESVRKVRVTAFESPRFTTPQTGQEQDLGEMMVHPEQTPDDILQIYGIDNSTVDPIEQAHLNGFLLSPSASDVKAARQALAQYQTALKTRDLETLHKLVSPLSLGWSADRPVFLEQCSLVPQCETDPVASNSIRALPLVSRNIAARVLEFSAVSQGANGGIDADAILRELDRNPHLVFLAEQRKSGIELAGVLRKEGEGWHVVALPSSQLTRPFNSVTADFQDSSDFTRIESLQDRSYFTRIESLPAAAQNAARQTAENYLHAWAQNHVTTVQDLTSPFARFHAKSPEEFKKELATRQDEGICPLNPEDAVVLQPLNNLTVWDQNQLTHQICNWLQLILSQNLARAFFRYTSLGQAYLMELVCYDGKWTVLEPALPM